MKSNKGIGFGFFLLTVGVIWILVSVGVITWSVVNALFVLWPLILVLIGVNIIFRHNEIIKGVAWVAFLAVIISYGYFFEERTFGSGTAAGESVTFERTAEIQKGKLNIAFGGTKIILDSDTDRLLQAETRDKGITYREDISGGEATYTFSKKKYDIFDFGSNFNNRYNNFHLSSEVPWNIDIDTGAVDGKLDMTELAVEQLTLDMGAANLELTFGGKYPNPRLDIDAGASKVEINVPSDAGVKVDMDGALNSTNLNGPDWEKRGRTYYSKNYDNAAVKIDVDIDMGVGKFTVDFE